jgi:NitT/TauT family transport system ATP-binding protein
VAALPFVLSSGDPAVFGGGGSRRFGDDLEGLDRCRSALLSGMGDWRPVGHRPGLFADRQGLCLDGVGRLDWVVFRLSPGVSGAKDLSKTQVSKVTGLGMYKLEQVFKNYGNLAVLQDLTLEFPEKRITAILGPSGCGKTTLLNILAGLVPVTAGRVVTTTPVSYLFQEPRLLPWLTVRENLDLVLRDRLPAATVTSRVEQYLDAVGVAAYRDFFPGQLSGGLRQRVALARAYSFPADLLLMDEPFKSLDLKVRYRLITDFLGLWQQQPRTVVLVTHDVKEAVLLGDRIVILADKPTTVARIISRDAAGDKADETANFQLERELLALLLK